MREDPELIAVPKLAKASLLVGIYGEHQDRPLGSTLALWVPVPTKFDHLPGIFLRLGNASGSVYTRMTPDDLAKLSAFIIAQSNPLVKAYYLATTFREQLESYYKKAWQDTLPDRPVPPIFPPPAQS